MGSYISYIIDGIWEAKQCILLGIILWLLWNLILFSLKKRSGEKLKKYVHCRNDFFKHALENLKITEKCILR